MANNGAGTASLNKSTATFTTALTINAIVAGVEIGVFALIFKRFKKIYEPRTYLTKPGHRAKPLPRGLLGWIPTIIHADTYQIIANNGLDAYMFVRFLTLMLWIFAPFTLVSWLILLPVDAAKSGGTLTGIDRFTFGNIGLTKPEQARYAAHLLLTYIFTFYVFFLIKREMAKFVTLRHEFLTSKAHSDLAQSKTVLLTGIPKNYQSLKALTKFTSYLGGVQNIWLVRDLGKKMPDAYDRRVKACAKLEAAETSLMKLAAKNKLKAEKKAAKGKGAPAGANGATTTNHLDAEKSGGDAAAAWVPKNKRPTHRQHNLPIPLPFYGKKVDSIEWAREEVATCNKELETERAGLNDLPPQGAAFIQFNSQIGAHMFQQCTAHDLPLRMSGRYVEVAPEDVIWNNLNINPYQAQGRYYISWAITLVIIIFWAIPVAFVGLISNVSELCAKEAWLAWLCKLPGPVNGIIQGVLPPVALAVLFMVLPIIIRLLIKFEGTPLHSLVERGLMVRYFIFLVIHGFLVVTLASGLVSALPAIADNPGSTVSLLATYLPQASTFFLTYFVTVGVGGAAGSLLQIVPLVLGYVLLVLLGSTPRKVYNIKFSMGKVQWGTLFPNMTLLTVIGLTYSIISPLVNAFALLAFALFWFVYKYLFIYVYDMPHDGETGGLFFPTAIQHLFTGLYIEEICLMGLFFLARDTQNKASALPEAVLMIILIVFTALFHITIMNSYKPLIHNLPISLAERIEEIQGRPPAPRFSVDGNTGEVLLPEHMEARRDAERAEKAERRSFDFVDASETPVGAGASRDVEYPTKGQLTAVTDEHPSLDRAPTPLGLDGRQGNGTAAGKANQPDRQVNGSPIPLDEVDASGRRHIDHDGLRLDLNAFDPPATYEKQTPVWLPNDTLGIAKTEVASLQALGIEASCEGAHMTEKGKVDISRSPPEMDWEEEKQS